MTHLPDTNICSAHMRRPGGLAHRFFQYASGIAISTVVLAELYSGAYKHPNPSRLLALIADLLQEVTVLDFDSACAEQFGKAPSPDERSISVMPLFPPPRIGDLRAETDVRSIALTIVARCRHRESDGGELSHPHGLASWEITLNSKSLSIDHLALSPG